MCKRGPLPSFIRLFPSCGNRAIRRTAALRILFLAIAAVPLSCSGIKKLQVFSINIETQKTGTSAPISVEAAITAEEQQRGFMHRKEIPDGTGMIFVYSRDSQLRFWMKDTPHPLSIAFIDSAGRIREIYDMQPFSLDVIASTHSVRYALEVAQGYFERAGISVGSTLSTESLERLKTAAQ